MTRRPSHGPLRGLAALDLTRLLPGGYCSLLLADLGTDVIKVEQPGRGDHIRWMQPLVDGQSAAHRALNRGKRSITLDLKAPEGVAVLRRLLGAADVLVESFRPGVMDRLGVGYEVLSAGDLGGGMLAAVGILAALVARATTGEGRFVDASMLDGLMSWLSIHAGQYLATGEVPVQGAGPLSGGHACYRVYRTGDGRALTVGALEPRFWRTLCEALGCSEFADHQYGPPAVQRQMGERLEEIFAQRSRDEWLAALEHLPVCVGPVNDLAEALADPQVRHRRMIAEVAGVVVGPGPALKLSAVPSAPLRPAPGLGEHTAEVLATIGVEGRELRDLRARGVV